MCLTLLLTTSFFAVDFSSRHPQNTQIQQVVYDLSRHNWYFFQVKKIYSFSQWRSNVRVGVYANIPKKISSSRLPYTARLQSSALLKQTTSGKFWAP